MSHPMKVAILGSTGMLGSMVKRFLSQQSTYELTCPERRCLDATDATKFHLVDILAGHDYAINCIGIIKPRIDEQDWASVQRAIQVNALFPQRLAAAAELTGCQVLQIATDCVYSGRIGSYDERAPHDAMDVYGKTKSLGEARSSNVHHLRCSIIGPEDADRPKDSLLEWFLGQPQGATVKGYTNHRWNGITTLAFAKICHGIMSQSLALPPILHVIPTGATTKARLLFLLACAYNRSDICIEDTMAPVAISRVLDTQQSSQDWDKLWKAAGYADGVPYIQQMIEELVAYQ